MSLEGGHIPALNSAPKAPEVNDLYYDIPSETTKRWNGTSWVVQGSGTFAYTDQPNGASTIPLWTGPDCVVADEFERTSTTSPGTPDQGSPWAAISGTWGTDGHNLYVVTHGGGTYDLATVDSTKANVVVEADFTFGTTPDAGIALRAIDANNFIAVELTAGAVNIFKYDGGSATQVATVTTGRKVTDAATTNGSPTITSLTANFAASDIGLPVTCTGIAAGAGIAAAYTPTTAPAWTATTAEAVGNVIIPTPGNGHLYQCTVAGTTGSSQPTFPTNGTTVTDGTVTWKDMGAATAAIASVNASSTGTGRTATIGTLVSGGTHSVKAAADLDSISVTVDGVPRVAYAMSAGEVTKYGTVTTHGVFAASGEGTLTPRFAVRPVSLRAAYNGSAINGSAYQIGRGCSATGWEWFKALSPILSAVATWEGTSVKDPCLLYVNGTSYLFYSGGTTSQIGVATSTDGGITWTKYASNPVLPNGPTGSWDANGVNFANVIYDASDPDPNQRWKMWYTGHGTDGIFHVGYAYSPDGLTWTKYVGNPVLRAGVVNSYDAIGVMTPLVFKIGSLWHMLYEARQVASNEYIAHATFSNPKSRYTKDPANALIGSRKHATQTLTANLNAGTNVVTVADTSVFEQGEPVLLAATSGATTQVSSVLAITSPTQLTLASNAAGNFTTANGAYIVSAYYAGMAPRAILQMAATGRYRLLTSAFRMVLVPAGELHEFSVSASAASPAGPYKFDFNEGLILAPGGVTTWDSNGGSTTSTENISVAVVAAA